MSPEGIPTEKFAPLCGSHKNREEEEEEEEETGSSPPPDLPNNVTNDSEHSATLKHTFRKRDRQTAAYIQG